MDPTLIDQGNLMDGDWANYSWNDSTLIWRKITVIFGNSQQ